MPLSPTEWSRESTGVSYADWLRNKSVHTRAGGWTNATHDQVTEGVGKDGRRFKHTTDQLGNEVVQHGQDQQSVRINAPHVRVASTTTEERNV